MRSLLIVPLLACALATLHPARAQQPAPISAAARPVAADTARNRTITGVVLDARSKQPLPGVTVLIKGTSTGASTAANGRYSLWVPAANTATLRFSSVGYVTQERLIGRAQVVNVTLLVDAKQLSEVVISPLQGKVAGVMMQRAASPRGKKARRVAKASGAGYTDYEMTADKSYAPAQSSVVMPAREEAGAGDTYAHVKENAFFDAKKTPLSTFALDVDNASYANVRRFLNEGQLPPRDAVWVEKMLNYFRSAPS